MLTVFMFSVACYFGGLFIVGAVADNTGPRDPEPEQSEAEAMLHRLTKGE